MKIILSPAKSLDYNSQLPSVSVTQPLFLKEANKLNNILSKKNKEELRTLMQISDNLADLNFQRYKSFSTPFTNENSRPAIYAFSGDVYTGLDAYTIPEDKIDLLQQSVRILSGMYGVLKPLDLMQPYRLEMGTDLKVNQKNNLYEFWGNKITEALSQELKENEIVLNLASVEYFKSVNAKHLNGKLVSPVFKDFKNGKLKIISFFAKKARGSMARFVIDKNVQNYQEILLFDYDGYSYSEKETRSIDKPVFIR